ncbi:glycosyltransferase family protein [Ketobacter alkanivorans]|uniref:Surface carbohydrate biosynthesis protein n=1 Tax=Ketobacter alkanivorans TaxID=1917421 RepID=A0A2K9LNA3_9GAMM|nr:hypothetical protein [Ketobacter alkanivorans]AUM13753.1 hypothetical protein Kalk_15560 [Ketobacter alkanivorans]
MTDHINIQIDLATRELPYLTILKTILENKFDLEISLLPQDPIWCNGTSSFFKTSKQKCDLLVTPSYNAKRTLNTLAWKHRSNSKLVHFHSEQLIDPRFYEEKLNTTCSLEYDRDVEYHLVWGEEFAKLLHEVAGVPKNRIYIVGCPKLSLIDRDKLVSRDTPNNKKVLFVSDFLWATMPQNQYNWALKKYGIRPEDDFQGFYKTALDKFIATAHQFSISNPDIDVVLRPHPGESQEAYRSLSELNNVEIDIGTPFIESAVKADLIVQFLSTSFFESIYLGKPVICLDLVEQWGTHHRNYFKYYNFVKQKDFESTAKNYLDNSQSSYEVDDTCINELFSADKGDSILRSAAALSHILSISKNTFSTPILQDKIRSNNFILQHMLKNVAGIISTACISIGIKNTLLQRVKNAQLKWENSPEYFDSDTILQVTNRFLSSKYQNFDFKYHLTETKYGNLVEVQEQTH